MAHMSTTAPLWGYGVGRARSRLCPVLGLSRAAPLLPMRLVRFEALRGCQTRLLARFAGQMTLQGNLVPGPEDSHQESPSGGMARSEMRIASMGQLDLAVLPHERVVALRA